jgi:carboxymethylenebutenolidase
MISTPSIGLTAGMVEFTASGGVKMPAYRARPAEPSVFPAAILVIQEIFGVHEHIRDICRRLAMAGYYAIAPELYIRQGDASKYSLEQIPQLFADIVSKVPQEQVLADLDACVAYAKHSGEADVARLGITGFCWGGTITWLYCARNPGVEAGVAWYGRLNADATALQPKRPVDIAAELKAPVLGLYGGKDAGIPLSDVELMREKLKTAHKDSKIDVFSDAGHAFLADYRPSYREDDAEEGWTRMLDWFHNHMRADAKS